MSFEFHPTAAFREVALVASRELRRAMTGAKGVATAVIAAFTALVSSIRFSAFGMGDVQADLSAMRSAEFTTEKAKMFGRLYGNDATGHYLAKAPLRAVVVFFVVVWLTPLVTTLFGFDVVSSELQHNTVRYWLPRVRRHAFVVGKYVGLFTLVAFTTLVIGAVGLFTNVKGESAGDLLGWGLRFWLATLPLSAAWCGLLILFAAPFRTPFVSLMATCFGFFALFVASLIGRGTSAHELIYLYPNTYDAFFVSPEARRVGIGLAACLGFVVVTLGAKLLVFEKRDL